MHNRIELFTLTKAQIHFILVDIMGWEPVDARTFCRLARKNVGAKLPVP